MHNNGNDKECTRDWGDRDEWRMELVHELEVVAAMLLKSKARIARFEDYLGL